MRENLYHVIDPDENSIPIDQRTGSRSDSFKAGVSYAPQLEPLLLVDIPLKEDYKSTRSSSHVYFLLKGRVGEDARCGCGKALDAEQAEFIQDVMQVGTVLEAMVTQRLMEQFRTLCQQDRDTARRVRAFLDRMQFTLNYATFSRIPSPINYPSLRSTPQ